MKIPFASSLAVLVAFAATQLHAAVATQDFGSPPQFISDSAATLAPSSMVINNFTTSGPLRLSLVMASAFSGTLRAGFDAEHLRCEADLASQGMCGFGFVATAPLVLYGLELVVTSSKGGTVVIAKNEAISFYGSAGGQLPGTFSLTAYNFEPQFLGLGGRMLLEVSSAREALDAIGPIKISYALLDAGSVVPEPSAAALAVLALALALAALALATRGRTLI